MPSITQRLVARHAEAKEAQEVRGDTTPGVSDRRGACQPGQPVQTADDCGGPRRGRAPSSDDPRTLARRVARAFLAYDQEDAPQEADVEVDGDSEDTDWNEPSTDWMDEKKAAVRRAIACLMNDVESLPGVGRRIERVVRQVGTADLYFDDGSFVSAQVEDPQPQVGGILPKKPGCGCKHAASEVDLVAAVRRDELLGAMDARKRGAEDPRYWRIKVEPPFELHRLSGVPMRLAVPFTDIGTRPTRLQSGRQGWRMAREFASGRPFKQVR